MHKEFDFEDGIPYDIVMRDGNLIKELHGKHYGKHIVTAQLWEYEGKTYRLLWDEETGNNLSYTEHEE